MAPKKKTTVAKARKRPPKDTDPNNQPRLTFRLSPAVQEAADLIITKVGLGTRTDILRLSMYYGLDQLTNDPGLLTKAQAAKQQYR